MITDYIGKIWNASQNIYKNYEILTRIIHFSKVTKVFKQSNIQYINKPQYTYIDRETVFTTNCTFKIIVHAVH